MPHVKLAPAVLLALLLAACASTPASRIEKDPASFTQLTPEQQEKVRAGQVAVGFDAAATRLALGEPDRVLQKTTAAGETEIWQYVDVYTYPSGPCYGAFFRYGLPSYCFAGYYGAPAQETKERMRVSFEGGKVVSVEKEK
ncbi:MAG: hypothetical protein EPN60_11995 [Nevskiaceae bacterium]|nr:MAG: hypothetical protein EPN60_11995 [Nevskiaceae bacterium]